MKKLSLLLGLSLVALTAFVSPHSTKQDKFENFLSELRTLEFPFQIEIEDLTSRYAEYECLSDDEFERRYRKMETFKDFLPETSFRFSRLGPPLVEPLAKMEVSQGITGVVYSTFRDQQFASENAFLILFFDRKGNPIDHKMADRELKKKNWLPSAFKPDIKGYALAFQGLENTQTVKLEKDGTISIELFENLWAKDIYEHGLAENEITAYQPISTEELLITSKGKIKSLPKNKVAKTARASIR
ncbi:MAG: hypothetical protein HRU41_25880 [Saprospiraceae bacterium]|nr:hypothetical protein [Saprospiraceae bacterium]